LTGVTEIVPVAPYTGSETDVRNPIAIETNHITGDYVVCWVTKGTSLGVGTVLNCTRFDDSNTALATGELPTARSFSTGMSIDAAVNDQGQFFAAATLGDDGEAILVGFDSDGTFLWGDALPGQWSDLAITVTPDFLWVGGNSYVTSPSEVSTLEVYLYNPDNGSDKGHKVFFQENTLLAPCRTSDLASTTSGDVLLTWVRGTACEGTVWGRTFLQDGTPITDEIQLSRPVDVPNSNPVSKEHLNFAPRAIAHDNGEYVVTWFNKTTSMLWSAALTFGGAIAAPQKSLIAAEEGTPFGAAGYPQNRDFIALASFNSPNPDCTLQSRLLFEGDLTPEANIPMGFCTLGFDIAFSRGGDMMLARWSNPQFGEDGQIEVAIFPRPAEIEVSGISVAEGNPPGVIGNYAILTASLSRPHPLDEGISVNYFTRDITAFAGLDYQQTSDLAIFVQLSGETSRIIQIPIIADTDYEANELFSVNLANASNAVLKKGGEIATVRILNDDLSPEILPDCDGGDPTRCRELQEGGPGQFTNAIITLTLAEAVDLPISIDYETQPGGPVPANFASPGSDYVNVFGTLQFPAGFTKASFAVNIKGDDVPENTETFQVKLSAGPSINLPQKTLTFHILDDALCFLELDTENLVFEMGGGALPVELTTLDSTCQWSALADQPWVTLDPPTGSGSQTVNVTADSWVPSGQVSRSAGVTIDLTGGIGTDTATLSIDQDGDCSFSTDAAAKNFPANGGTGTITVTASDPTCEWFIFTDQPWINISSPTSPVKGSGTVSYSVSGNGSINVENGSRMTMLTSEEIAFQVTQDGCVYDVNPATVTVDAKGNAAVDINVMAGPSVCQWTAVSNSVWAIVESGASGGGGGTTRLDVIENPSVVARVGSVQIADELITVNQDGQPCEFSASPSSMGFCPDEDNFAINVDTAAGCEWSLMESVDWVSFISNATGNGEETAMGLVEDNLSEVARTSTIKLVSTESGLPVFDVQIEQQGFLEYESFDGSLPVGWLFDPTPAFSVTGGQLKASLSGGGVGRAIHQNPFGTCRDCKIESSMKVTSVSSESQEVVTLVGWYVSDDEFIGLGMDEFANTWTLYQVSGGATVASSSVNVPQILPNQAYAVSIRYDGTMFRGFVDGAEVVSVNRKAGSDPWGYAGFMVNASNAQFPDLRVTGVFEPVIPDIVNPDIILSDSFEDFQPAVARLDCSQQ